MAVSKITLTIIHESVSNYSVVNEVGFQLMIVRNWAWPVAQQHTEQKCQIYPPSDSWSRFCPENIINSSGKRKYIESVVPSNHLILCCPFLLLPSVFPSPLFSSELALDLRQPKYWSFSFSISPSSEYSGLISFRIDWFDLLAVQGTLKSPTPQFKSINSLSLSLLYRPTLTSIHDYWKNHSFDYLDSLSAK